jgi:hypothetical protein
VRSKEVPFTDLTVPLTSSATTIPRALAEYFKPQPMSYRKKSATRSESLASLPPVLAVTLGRFEASFANNRLSLTKLHTPVRLPTRLELPVPSSAPPETLRLAAVIVHKGEFEYVRARATRARAKRAQRKWEADRICHPSHEGQATKARPSRPGRQGQATTSERGSRKESWFLDELAGLAGLAGLGRSSRKEMRVCGGSGPQKQLSGGDPPNPPCCRRGCTRA